MSFLRNHGFIINLAKSSLIPSQCITHLGLQIDTQLFQVCLSQERQENLARTLHSICTAKFASIQSLASLLGLMVSCQDVVPWSRFHLRTLQTFLRPYARLIERKAVRHLSLPSYLIQSLSWWRTKRRLQQGTSLDRPNRLIVTTDASLQGWGAHLLSHWAQGTWSAREASFSINRLELRAVRLALLHFKSSVRKAHVLILTDNVAAKAFINRQGGTRSRGLMREATLLLRWAEHNLASLRADHLPGVSNLEADWLSRQRVQEGEWSLNPEVFQDIVARFGQPTLDLFATRLNTQIPAFLSRVPDHQAIGTDALSFPWPRTLLYAFPPFPLIQAVLRRVRQLRASLILVAPDWPRRPWYPSIVNLAQGPPFHLPSRPDLLLQGPILHPNPGKYNLAAWFLRGED